MYFNQFPKFVTTSLKNRIPTGNLLYRQLRSHIKRKKTKFSLFPLLTRVGTYRSEDDEAKTSENLICRKGFIE